MGFVLVFRWVADHSYLASFGSLLSDFYVYSLTQESSLREVDNLRQQIYRIKGGNTVDPWFLFHSQDIGWQRPCVQRVPIVVVGTKSDLTAEREVQRSTIQRLASHWGLPFYETSAKRNWHVSDVFEDLIRQMRERYPDKHKKKRQSSDKCIVM